jgi:ribosome biogenesis GTPase / thiamine phosphate phosphatase
MQNLVSYGWDPSLQHYFQSLQTSLFPGRVISIKGFKYSVIAARGEIETELSGRLLFESENENLPKVGDWVLFQDYETMGYIIDLFPRKNALSRKSPGAKFEKQVLAANIDRALIVMGLDRDFNLMRLERYLVQVSSCDIEPVVILNKADLVEDIGSYLDQIAKLQRDCRIFSCSTLTGMGLPEIRMEIFQPHVTLIMIGSSGVGKSSLLNSFSHTAVQATRSVSDFNQKGKHTTTTRDLFLLPGGAMMIDTPGMREFGVTFEQDASEENVFPEITRFSERCRYNDCRHIEENGCAVLEALQQGALDSVVYDSYIKLLKEQRRFQVTADEKKRMNKQFGKISKEATNHRKKFKY